MTRLHVVENAEGHAEELLSMVQKTLGMRPNMMKVMANSPAVLEAYISFSGALSRGKLPATVREQIALVAGQANGCDYCLAAHSLLGKMTGLSDSQLLESRKAQDVDTKVSALLTFGRKLVDERGSVSDADIAALRNHGWDDGQIAEVVANVALNIFTNYVNHVADTAIDFPAAPTLGASCSTEKGKSGCGCD